MSYSINEVTVWFLSVVVAGLLINLAAAYLKPWLDTALSKVSTKWAARTAEQREARDGRIAYYSRDTGARVEAGIGVLESRITCVTNMVVAYGAFAFTYIANTDAFFSTVFIAFGVVTIVMGMGSHANATNRSLELREARRSETQQERVSHPAQPEAAPQPSETPQDARDGP